MNAREKVLLGLAIIAGFIFAVSTLALLLQASLPKEMCYPWNWIPYLLTVIASLGVFVGGLIHYLTLEYAERKLKYKEEMTKKKAILNCLPEEERKIVELLLDGPKFQSEIRRLTGLDKVKVHRLLKRLEARGVIQIEKIGKTNIIRLVLK